MDKAEIHIELLSYATFMDAVVNEAVFHAHTGEKGTVSSGKELYRWRIKFKKLVLKEEFLNAVG